MTNSMKQTVIKNPTWWRRRSAMERGLTITLTLAIMVVISMVITTGIVVSRQENCEDEELPQKMEMLPASTGALRSNKSSTGTNTVVDKKAALKDICLTPGCVHAASQMLSKIDFEVEPCDNFYRFACGEFLKSTVIPDDETAVTTFSVIGDKLMENLRISLEEKIEDDDLRAFKLAKNFYKACMNETLIEEKGLTPALELMKKVGGWPVLEGDKWREDDFDWKQSVYKFRELGLSVDYFFDFSVSVDLKNSTRRVLDIDQANLGVSREYLIRGPRHKIIDAYYKYMVDIAVIFGAKRSTAESELEKSLLFEISLANISLSSEDRRDANKLYNPMTVKKLSRKFPSIPWKEYFNAILKPHAEIDENEMIIVNVPYYFEQFEKLMEQTPKRVQANYILWRLVASTVTHLNDEIRKRQLQYSTVVSGKVEKEPRWKECVYATASSLGMSVGSIYVRKYFNEDSKKNAVEMVNDIRQEFNKILKKVEWMDEKTRQSALEKANSMSTHIAYPDELLDNSKLEEFYEKLEITQGDYLQTILNLTHFGNNYSFSKLRKPVNKSDWVSHGRPAIVNAFYSSIENSIQFPAGILQGAFFSNDRPRYMNYGAIGFVIGHEITHGFDDQGRQFDKEGNLVEWWESTTKEKYLEKAKCIIEQYGNYTAKEVEMNLNGINTQGENIADNGGIKESYLAYQEWVKRNGPEPKLPGLDYTPSQLFWISAAQTWCSKYRPETLKLRITTGVHSPGEFRVLGPFSNRPEFSKDFKCSAGNMMNPDNKCSVW